MYYLYEADEKSSFTKEDMKEGKHIEYAKSLLEEMIKKKGKSERSSNPLRSTEQENSIRSDHDWFDVGSSDKPRDGEINTESNKYDVNCSESPRFEFEQTNADAFQQNSYSAADDDLG